jgi:hypothetical protein
MATIPDIAALRIKRQDAQRAEGDAVRALRTAQLVAGLGDDPKDAADVLAAEKTVAEAKARVRAIDVAIVEVQAQLDGQQLRLREAVRDAADLGLLNALAAFDKAAAKSEKAIAAYTEAFEQLRVAGAEAQRHVFLIKAAGRVRNDLDIPDVEREFTRQLARVGSAPGFDEGFRSVGGYSGQGQSITEVVASLTSAARHDLEAAKAARAAQSGADVDQWLVGGDDTRDLAPEPEEAVTTYGQVGHPLSADQAGPLASGGE